MKKKLKKFIFIFIYVMTIFVLPIHWIWKTLLFVGLIVFLHVTNLDKFFGKKNNCITMLFGPPGAGKTTFLSWLAQKRYNQGETVLSNVDIKNTYILDPKNDLGTNTTYFNGKGCTVLMDEATLDFDGRGFKSFSQENRNYFSLFRHDCNEVFCATQAVDIDKRIRDRANSAFYLQQFFTPKIIRIRKIKKILIIEENNKQLVDGFEFQRFSTRFLWAPPAWKFFDTLDRDLCCKKQKTWKSWHDTLPEIPPFSEEEIKATEEAAKQKKEKKKRNIIKDPEPQKSNEETL